MKNLFLMGMAAVSMMCASCSSDENVEMANNKNAIEFKTFVNNSTRATDLTTTSLMKFKLWGRMEKEDGTNKGGKPFDGTDFTRSGSIWNYTGNVYWEKDYKYSFQALAPHDAYTFNAPDNYGEWGSLTFDNKNGENDLIYAGKIADIYRGGTCPAAVNLNFNHLLSRVRFLFKNAMDDGSVVTVSNVKITNAYSKGTATLGENLADVVWTPTEPKELVFGNMTGKVDEVTGISDHKYMIPATATDYNITFEVTRVHHGVTDIYNHSAKISGLVLEKNKSYQLAATLDATNIDPENPDLCKIEFSVTVNEFEDFVDNTVTVPGN